MSLGVTNKRIFFNKTEKKDCVIKQVLTQATSVSNMVFLIMFHDLKLQIVHF